MSNEAKVSKWLRNNTNLSWTRTSGDSLAVKLDRVYINRSEVYEIRDFILGYYDCCNLGHKDDNYKNTFDKIIAFKKGEKVKSADMLNYLKRDKKDCC
jgi:methionine salvage enolase-phosphatase E1